MKQCKKNPEIVALISAEIEENYIRLIDYYDIRVKEDTIDLRIGKFINGEIYQYNHCISKDVWLIYGDLKRYITLTLNAMFQRWEDSTWERI